MPPRHNPRRFLLRIGDRERFRRAHRFAIGVQLRLRARRDRHGRCDDQSTGPRPRGAGQADGTGLPVERGGADGSGNAPCFGDVVEIQVEAGADGDGGADGEAGSLGGGAA